MMQSVIYMVAADQILALKGDMAQIARMQISAAKLAGAAIRYPANTVVSPKKICRGVLGLGNEFIARKIRETLIEMVPRIRLECIIPVNFTPMIKVDNDNPQK